MPRDDLGPAARTYTLTSSHVDRSALYSALMRDWRHRAPNWGRPLLLGLVLVLVLPASVVSRGLAVVLGLAVAVALAAFGYLRYERRVHGLLDREWPDGSAHQSVFAADGITFRGPQGAVVYRWSEVVDVRPEGPVVSVLLQPRKVRHFVPGALFPVEEIPWVREEVRSWQDTVGDLDGN